MKPRDFKLDSWWICTKYGYPGSVPVVEKGMAHAYALGIADATNELREALDREAERKRRSNEQR